MKTIVAVEPGFVSVSPPVNPVEAQMPVNEPKATNTGDCLNEEAIGREVLEPTDSTFRLLVGEADVQQLSPLAFVRVFLTLCARSPYARRRRGGELCSKYCQAGGGHQEEKEEENT